MYYTPAMLDEKIYQLTIDNRANTDRSSLRRELMKTP